MRLCFNGTLPAALCLLVLATACGGSSGNGPREPGTPTTPAPPGPAPPPGPQGPPTWNVETQGVPRFITHDYIDLSRIGMISRFRSAAGHSYTDEFESCRSMKHYFRPARNGAETIRIFSPVTGEITRTIQEWAGVQIWIRSKDYPAFTVILFHVNPSISTADGTPVTGGQQIGTHIGDQTGSDVGVAVADPAGFRLISWFEAIAEPLMAGYASRGLSPVSDAIITRSDRDASPLSCSGETFRDEGAIPNWVELR